MKEMQNEKVVGTHRITLEQKRLMNENEKLRLTVINL